MGSFSDVALCEGAALYGSVYVRKGRLEKVDSLMPAWRLYRYVAVYGEKAEKCTRVHGFDFSESS